MVESNLSYYMMIVLFSMAAMNLMKDIFKLGYFRYSDETKIELLFGIKSLVTVFVCLKYIGCSNIIDYDLEDAHNKTLERLN